MRRFLFPLIILFLGGYPFPSFAQFVPGVTWYWQLSGNVNVTETAKVYDVDAESATTLIVQQLKSAGHVVVCYIDAGAWEPYRSDASSFPKDVIGAKQSGWDENYLDTRSPIVRDLMSKRIDAAKEKGCDAIEPDNTDSYTASTGFPLNRSTAIDYAQFLSTAVHQRGMLVALKNTTDLVKTLVNSFDFSIAEQCFQYHECTAYAPFINQNKAVLVAEYKAYNSRWCRQAKLQKLSLVFYNLALNGKKYQPCQ